MAKEERQLFADNGQVPIKPSVSTEPTDTNSGQELNLMSKGIEKAICGETVKSLMIPEDFELIYPNFVLDFRKAKTLRKHQIHALTTIVCDEGDTAIYVILNNGTEKLGMGVGSLLNKILPIGLQSIFGDACILYQDVERDKQLREIRRQDISKIRLEL